MTKELEEARQSGFLEYERLPAVNGSTVEVSGDIFSPVHDHRLIIQEFMHDWYGKDIPMPMAEFIMEKIQRSPEWSDGERGCAMSHLHAWRKVAASSEPMLVFEDDGVLQPDFMETLRESKSTLVSKFGSEVDILYLQFNTFAKMMNLTAEDANETDPLHGHAFKEKVERIGARWLLKSDFVMDSAAYLLWPSGAEKLLASLPLNYTAGLIPSVLVHRGKMAGFAINPPLVNQLWMTDMTDPAAMNNIAKITVDKRGTVKKKEGLKK